MTIVQARRYMGPCGGCEAKVQFGDLYVRRERKVYHWQHDPKLPPPTCRTCGGRLDIDREPSGHLKRDEHVFCGRIRMALMWWYPLGGWEARPKVEAPAWVK